MAAAADDTQFAPDVAAVRRSAERWRWILGLTVLVMVGLAWATWVEITTHERRQAEVSAARRQGNLAIAVGQYVTRTLANADAVGQFLAGMHAAPGVDFAAQMAGRARGNPLFTEISACFADGAVLTSAAGAPDRRPWCAGWLAEAPPAARTYPAQPVQLAGSTLVPLLTRVPATQQRPAGVIVLAVDARHLLGLMQAYTIPDETAVLVTGSDGRPRARWHSATRMEDQRAPEAAVLPAVLAAGTLGQPHRIDGRQMLVSARPLQAFPLTVLVATSHADTLAVPRQRSFYYALACGVATALILLFALLLLRLQDQSVRAGVSLARARERLEALNADLEAQVRARTGELEAAYRDLEAFSYTVAHDVRAPIAAIRGFADALAPAVQAWGNEKSAHYLRRIVANATQMSDLTESLLSLGQLTRAPIAMRPVDLSAQAREVLAGLREREGARRAVDAEVQDGLVVQGDRVLLRQVLENLLSNAWKFSAGRAPAVIRVSGERDAEGHLTVAVHDNGEGFDMAAGADVFQPFRRMHASGTFPGTGVGLATVERILRLHGARPWIASSPERGTTVFFRMRGAAA